MGDRPDRTGQAAAFDAIGKQYDQAFPHKEGQLSAGCWLIDTLAPGAAVLDVGSGTGLPTARQLQDAGLRVVGVDLSETMVELARANVPDADFHQLDIADLQPDGPSDLGRFDAVTAFFSLLMLPRAEIPVALGTIRGLLRDRGLLALSMVEADLDDAPIPFLGHTLRVSAYPRTALREVVEQAGFEILEQNCFSYVPEDLGAPPEKQVFLHCRRR